MILCEACHHWQHANCFGLRGVEEVPESHFCDLCHKVSVSIFHVHAHKHTNAKNLNCPATMNNCKAKYTMIKFFENVKLCIILFSLL